MSGLSPRSLLRVAPRPLFAEPVLMVIPPSVFLLDERVFMSLGILKVAASLEQAGYRVEMLDLAGVDNFIDVVDLQLRTTSAQVVALTATTPQLPAAVQIAQRVRHARPDMRIVLGGPHVTLVHSAVKLERKAGRVARAHKALGGLERTFDVLVAGDGELAVLGAVQPNAPKLVDADDPRSGLFMTDDMYEGTPLAARGLVDVLSYRYSIDGHRATSLIAQLGCPFGCGFCGGRNSKSLRLIRSRGWQSVVRELDLLHEEYGFTGYMLYDDELNVNPGMIDLMNGIAELQARKGVEFRLRGFIKAELFTAEQAEAMYRAGFRWILCGFEAASTRILQNINKRATLEDNTRVIEIARRHGLRVKALMSVGHPGESESSVRSVHDWLVETKPDDFDCTIITTYPGTPYYDEATPHGTLSDVWTYTSRRSGDRLYAYDVDFTTVAEYYKGNPDGGYRAYVFTDYLSSEQLVTLRDWVERSVRTKLNIPFNPGAEPTRYEHSMGQGFNGLPASMLRSSPTHHGS